MILDIRKTKKYLNGVTSKKTTDLYIIDLIKKINIHKSYSIPINTKYTTSTGFYPRELSKIEIDDSGHKKDEKVFEWSDVKKDYRLVYNRLCKRYTINCPVHRELKNVTPV